MNPAKKLYIPCNNTAYINGIKWFDLCLNIHKYKLLRPAQNVCIKTDVNILDKNRLYICDNSIGIEEFCILLTKYITDSKQPSVSPHNKPHVKNTEIVTFFDGKNAINNIFRVSSINPLNIMAVIKSEITVFELKIGKFKT